MKILKPPSDAETDEVFNQMNPEDALQWSIKNKLPEYFKKAIKRCVTIDSEIATNTLINAANDNHLDEIKFFIENGIDVNSKNNRNGWTALMVASSMGYLDIVKYLVEHGAIIDDQDIGGDTALMISSYNGYLDVVKYLIEKGADISLKNKLEETALDGALESGRINMISYLHNIGAKSYRYFYKW